MKLGYYICLPGLHVSGRGEGVVRHTAVSGGGTDARTAQGP